MRIKLPFPPTVNTIWVNKPNGRYMSTKGKAYRANAMGEILDQHGIFKPLTGRLTATVELIPPDKRKRDIDNYCKALFDSLAHANVFMDDSQIKELHIYMLEPSKPGGCTVILEEL